MFLPIQFEAEHESLQSFYSNKDIAEQISLNICHFLLHVQQTIGNSSTAKCQMPLKIVRNSIITLKYIIGVRFISNLSHFEVLGKCLTEIS